MLDESGSFINGTVKDNSVTTESIPASATQNLDDRNIDKGSSQDATNSKKQSLNIEESEEIVSDIVEDNQGTKRAYLINM